MRATVLLVGLLGCTIGEAVEQAMPPSYVQTLPDGPCATGNVTGTLPGVTLAIHSDSCVYRQGELATFTYEVTVDGSVPTITIPADPQTGGCGTCVSESSDPISFLWPTIAGTSPDGTDQLYCPGVAAGCCPAHGEITIQLQLGTFSRVVEWSGHTIECPSDTGLHEGPLFPPGRYDTRARFYGYASGSVASVLPVEVLDP